jgi:hypothetical protein
MVWLGQVFEAELTELAGKRNRRMLAAPGSAPNVNPL